MTLLDDLREAEAVAAGVRSCPACDHLANMEPGPEKSTLGDALAGTIGMKKLAAILRKHDIPLGRRVIAGHRAHLKEQA